LSSEVAAQRLIENGPNILAPPKQVSPFVKFLHCLTSLFNLLLILAGILNYVLLAIDPAGNKVNVSTNEKNEQFSNVRHTTMMHNGKGGKDTVQPSARSGRHADSFLQHEWTKGEK